MAIEHLNLDGQENKTLPTRPNLSEVKLIASQYHETV